MDLEYGQERVEIMKRLTKQWGNNPAVPCNFDLYDGGYGDYKISGVTHWMPLLEPLKEVL